MYRNSEVIFHLIASIFSVALLLGLVSTVNVIFFIWSGLMATESMGAIMRLCHVARDNLDYNAYLSLFITLSASGRFMSSYWNNTPLDEIDAVITLVGSVVKFFI